MDNFNQMVANERTYQDTKWGEQNHEPTWWLAILVEEVGELAKAILETEQGLEDTKSVEAELVQIAAVAKAMWESGKRRSWL